MTHVAAVGTLGARPVDERAVDQHTIGRRRVPHRQRLVAERRLALDPLSAGGGVIANLQYTVTAIGGTANTLAAWCEDGRVKECRKKELTY